MGTCDGLQAKSTIRAYRRTESAVVGIAGAVSAVRCYHHNPHEMEVVQHTLWQSLCSKPMWIVVTTVPAMIRRVGPHRNGEPRTLELTRVPRPGPGRPPPPPTSVPPQAPSAQPPRPQPPQRTQAQPKICNYIHLCPQICPHTWGDAPPLPPSTTVRAPHGAPVGDPPVLRHDPP